MIKGINKDIQSRSIGLIGEESIKNFATKRIAILGLGGVGGTALEALARSGFMKFVIVDGDRVDLSNLNRQILYCSDEVGLRKVDCAASHLGCLTDGIDVFFNHSFITPDNVEEILGKYRIDFIVDAIDDILGKIALIKYANKKNIPIVVTVGMGNRLDPTKIEIIPLDKTTDDPLAKSLRQKCRKEGIDCASVMAVHSKEHPLVKTPSPMSMIMVPSAAGLFICYHIVNHFMIKEEENEDEQD